MQRIWRRIFGERSRVEHFGDFREKADHGLIERQNYVYGMLRAADTARYFDKKAVTVCEFGVATGAGLLNMVDLAGLIGRETGVRFRVVGFDTGAGLPAPTSYKDHPELWSGGDFSMGDTTALRARLASKAELILGDINDTIDGFVATLTPDSPLGFVSVDVDIYTGTVAALRGLHGQVDRYLPAVSFYLDDVSSYFSNRACGELLAVAEHNAAMPLRPIDRDRSLPGWRMRHDAAWYKAMYVCHLLDHPYRNAPRNRRPLGLEEHLDFMSVLR